MKSVLITGVSGFIGPHVVEACLKHGLWVTGLDIRPYTHYHGEIAYPDEFIHGDVRELNIPKLQDFNYIIHLAFVTNIPYSIQNPISTTRDNVEMTARLLEMASEAEVRKLVFSSTASLYGHNPTPWRQDMPSDPHPI